MLRVTRPRPRDPAWGDRTLGSLLDDAPVEPGALAVVEGGRRLTYADLRSQVSGFARHLAALGVVRGDVVTVIVPNWWESAVVFHAIARLGAIANPVIPIYRDREIGFILEQARPQVIVTAHAVRGFDFVACLQRLAADGLDLPAVMVVRPEGQLPPGIVAVGVDDGADVADVADSSRPEDLALLLYTSGTTADPKGVLHTHQTLEYELRSIVDLWEMDGEDVMFMPSPVCHITGYLYGIFVPSVLGVKAVLLDAWDPAVARRMIESEGCRFTLGATPFLRDLVDVHRLERASSSLRMFCCGGADVPPELVREARSVLGSCVVRGYGSSEVPTFTGCGPSSSAEVAADTDGHPIGAAEYRIEDARDGIGELVVKAPELFVGYLDATLNEDAFTADGFFRTGDLVSEVDGSLVVRGRAKDIIIRNGENISVREIEDHVHEHPAVREVAIVAVPDARRGEVAWAFVVPIPGSTPTLGDLTSFLDGRRIAKQKYPERIVLVEDLPRTASGKVQKYRLRQLADGGADEGDDRG